MSMSIVPATTAGEINRLHRAAQRSAGEALQLAKQAGDLLLDVKASLPHGGFLPWVATNVEVTARQAQKYMRLAKNWEAITANTKSTSHLGSAGIDAALEHLAEPRPATADADADRFVAWLADFTAAADKFSPRAMREFIDSLPTAERSCVLADCHITYAYLMELRQRWAEATPRARARFVRDVLGPAA